MPAEIEVHAWCADYFAVFKVPGSKAGVTYDVTLDGTSFMGCTCPAYRFSSRDPFERECKHTKYVWDHACLYNTQWKDAGPRDIAPVLIDESRVVPGQTCPGCGGPVIAVRVAV